MRREVKPEQLNDWAHQHYRVYFTGDGSTTDYDVGRSIYRADNVRVTVDGQALQPHVGATQLDFGIRGLSQGYDGSKDQVRLAIPPAPDAQVCIEVAG